MTESCKFSSSAFTASRKALTCAAHFSDTAASFSAQAAMFETNIKCAALFMFP